MTKYVLSYFSPTQRWDRWVGLEKKVYKCQVVSNAIDVIDVIAADFNRRDKLGKTELSRCPREERVSQKEDRVKCQETKGRRDIASPTTVAFTAENV